VLRAGSREFLLFTKLLLWLALSLPLLHLLAGLFGLAGFSLGANPVERIQDTLGIWGLRLLLLTLAVTPLLFWTGRAWLLRYRRLLGLFAFFYILLHFVVYAGLDLRLDLSHLGEDLAKRPFITLGFIALCLLVPLAVTSTQGWMRRLGRRWQSLHRLVYPAAILGVWHYYWQVKLDTLEALVYALILTLLLGYRLLRSWRKRQRQAAKSEKSS
jgi:sulfoxide reductase heme-binding subunit YedZ